MVMPMTWRHCEIGNLPSGQPTIVVYGAMQAWMQERQLHAWISLTDETDYAASLCVVERR